MKLAIFLLLLLTHSQLILKAGIPQELNRITLVNETGQRLIRLFWAPSYQSDTHFQWGNSLIPYGKAMEPGVINRYFIHYPESCTFLDFLAVDARGTQYLASRIQVCNQEEQVIFLEPRNRLQRALHFDELVLNFIHDGVGELWFLFLSPQAFGMWGADVLGDTSLFGPGQERAFIFPFMRNSPLGLMLDIMALDSKDRVYVKKITIEPTEIETTLLFSQLSNP